MLGFIQMPMKAARQEIKLVLILRLCLSLHCQTPQWPHRHSSKNFKSNNPEHLNKKDEPGCVVFQLLNLAFHMLHFCFDICNIIFNLLLVLNFFFQNMASNVEGINIFATHTHITNLLIATDCTTFRFQILF